MPSIGNYAQASNTYAAVSGAGHLQQLNQQIGTSNLQQQIRDANQRAVARVILPDTPPKKPEPIMSRRLVQVFIADPDTNVPLAECLLYRGEQKVTDATDQELFFEIDIKTMLDQYNTKRTTWVDKKVKERTEHLEPARIRDLRMTVVEIAKF
jgi:hypothetical protein